MVAPAQGSYGTAPLPNHHGAAHGSREHMAQLQLRMAAARMQQAMFRGVPGATR